MPSHVIIRKVRVAVRAFKQKSLQFFTWFIFVHPSCYCKILEICNNCSGPEHGECSAEEKYVNYGMEHKYKQCEDYRFQEPAIRKASNEHLTVGLAKKL